MKRILAVIIIGLLCFSTFSTIAPRVNAETATAYLTDYAQLTASSYVDREPFWSPDSSKITWFAFDSSGWYRHIWVMNADGTGKTQLTSGDVVDEGGDWSPDGAQLVFARYGLRGLDAFDLMIMNSDGSNINQITSSGYSHQEPHWSNDGSKIAFSYGTFTYGWIYEIHVINPDGSNEATLIQNAYHANWSPDDSQVVVDRDDGIWLVDAFPPYEATRIYAVSPQWTYPQFSPDGKYILFLMSGDLHLIDTSGNYITQLTTDGTIEYPHDWSPNSQWIAFTSRTSGNPDIWKARIVLPTLSDFEISVSPISQMVTQSRSITYTVKLKAIGSFAAPVSLSVNGLPSGSSATFDPASVVPDDASVLEIDTMRETPKGDYTLEIVGTCGSTTHSIFATLTVKPPETLIITNKQKLIDFAEKDESKVGELIDEIRNLHPEGIIVFLDEEKTITNPMDWEQIDGYIEEEWKACEFKYLIILGSPKIVPFCLVDDPTELWEARLGRVDDGQIETDFYYAETSGDLLQDLMVGRIIGINIEDMINYVKNIRSPSQKGKALVCSSVFMGTKDCGTTVAKTLSGSGGLSVKHLYRNLVTGDLTNENFKKELLDKDFIFWGSHGDSTGLWDGWNIGQFVGSYWKLLTLENVIEAGLGTTDPIVFALSCYSARIHSSYPYSAALDFASAFINKGASAYIGSTANVNVGRFNVAWGEHVPIYFVSHLVKGEDVGTAFMNAKRDYYEKDTGVPLHRWTGTDEKTLLEFVLYGDPKFSPNLPFTQ